jgi:predicted RNA-binding protein
MTLSHYIFVAGDIYDEERLIRAKEICESLLRRRIWLIWRETPYQRDYRVGDRVLFYLARSGKCNFVGLAELDSEPEPATTEEIDMGEALGLIGYDRKVRLRNIRLFSESIPIRPLIEELTFIKDKRWWGHWFRQSAMRIPQKDFERVLAEDSR